MRSGGYHHCKFGTSNWTGAVVQVKVFRSVESSFVHAPRLLAGVSRRVNMSSMHSWNGRWP